MSHDTSVLHERLMNAGLRLGSGAPAYGRDNVRRLGSRHKQRRFSMRRFLIVAVGIAVLTLGAWYGSGTWATAFRPEPGELACETVKTPAGKLTSCSTVEETTLWQRLTTKYTYYTPGSGTVGTAR
jgi:hypothetical protein